MSNLLDEPIELIHTPEPNDSGQTAYELQKLKEETERISIELLDKAKEEKKEGTDNWKTILTIIVVVLIISLIAYLINRNKDKNAGN